MYLHFSVRDTGIGIAQDKQKMIFDAFSQADGSTTRKFGGTGLGLTISARLVEAMQGKIWVESAPSKGSCFHFTAALGVSSETRQLANLAEAILAGRNTSRGRRRQPYQPAHPDRTCCGAGGCCRRLPPAARRRSRTCGADSSAASPFSLVLTDVHMPEMDGFELVQRIHESPGLTKTVILMLTSGDRGDDIARCRKLGISSYLTKPVRRAELRAAIARALAHATPRGDLAVRLDDTIPDGLQDGTRTGLQTDCGACSRILLTEDNVVNQRVALRILEKAGHIVAIAENGKAALKMLDQQTFDLILMDVQMPEMGGFEATALIREKEHLTGRHIPIIAMTAHAMAGDRERCLDAGMDDYLAKPVAAASLLEMVARYSPKPLPV